MALKLANNAVSRLSSGISSGATTLTVMPGDGALFPVIGAGDFFPATLVKADGTYEIVKVTAVSVDTFTIERGKESTAAVAFSANDRIEHRMTAGTQESLMVEKATTAATSKTTPVDADEIPLVDSADSFKLKKLTWANLKATLKTYFDGLYLPLSGGTLTGLLKFKNGANIASAATVDLTAATGNTVHITGTTGITAWTMTAGQIMDVIFDGILTLTHHATNNNLPGLANITTAAGDRARYYFDGTTIWCMAYARADGTVQAKIMADVGASVASNALTVTINPEILQFRSATLTSGTPVTRSAASQGSLTVPSGATLGMVAGVQSRLVWGWIDNAGTLEPFITNQAGGQKIDEEGVISTTAISSSANSANVFYSQTARTNVAYRIRGYCDITEATAGTWATAPSLVQPIGGQAGCSMGSLGYGQTWQTVTRNSGTTYYNTTGRPIALSITANPSAFISVTIGGVVINNPNFGDNSGQSIPTAFYIIPPGASYVVTVTAGSIRTIVELR